jgi:N-acetylglucosaminylphosphatidylinositol deacetylase
MTALRSSTSSALPGQNILLVIAHPDYEVMFFGPTLIALTRPEVANSVSILCLSNDLRCQRWN